MNIAREIAADTPTRDAIAPVYFTEVFQVEKSVLDSYGAFNISLVTDLPLFIDPFLLFNSKKPEYQDLHKNILRYLFFLREKSQSGNLQRPLIDLWYRFPEVQENWLGFCFDGNQGRGLGKVFGDALHGNLNEIFKNFGDETITKSSHLEKLCLIKDRVGRDNISDFTTNLVKEFLANYTQTFARTYLRPEFHSPITVDHVRFNYSTESWERDSFDLPIYKNRYVLLTPKDILTRDDTWINRHDLLDDFERIPEAISNEQLRAQINNYFYSQLPKDREASKDERTDAVFQTLRSHPVIVDYFIKYKEDHGDQAQRSSNEKVNDSDARYVEAFGQLRSILATRTEFYDVDGASYDAAMARVNFLKDVIENKDGYRLFYLKGKPIEREEDLQIMYRLTWFASNQDVNREVNNGRGPVDFKVSRGSKDSTLVEFKLAGNRQLKKNLQNQVEIYQTANNTKSSIKAILFFSEAQHDRVTSILKELNQERSPHIVLIDARNDNKPSASKA